MAALYTRVGAFIVRISPMTHRCTGLCHPSGLAADGQASGLRARLLGTACVCATRPRRAAGGHKAPKGFSCPLHLLQHRLCGPLLARNMQRWPAIFVRAPEACNEMGRQSRIRQCGGPPRWGRRRWIADFWRAQHWHRHHRGGLGGGLGAWHQPVDHSGPA